MYSIISIDNETHNMVNAAVVSSMTVAQKLVAKFEMTDGSNSTFVIMQGVNATFNGASNVSDIVSKAFARYAAERMAFGI